MKIALDPTPFHHDYALLDFPRVVADLGYGYLQLTPHRDFIPFYNHPRADDALVAHCVEQFLKPTVRAMATTCAPAAPSAAATA